MNDVEPLGQMVEWEAHKQAKERIINLFQDANWEATGEDDLSLQGIDGYLHEYRGDVVAVKRGGNGEIVRRVVVEVDTIKPGGGHNSKRAFAKDDARAKAIEDLYKNPADSRSYITKVKRINTQDVIGKKKNHKEYFIDDDTLRLEFGITKLRDWAVDNA